MYIYIYIYKAQVQNFKFWWYRKTEDKKGQFKKYIMSHFQTERKILLFWTTLDGVSACVILDKDQKLLKLSRTKITKVPSW